MCAGERNAMIISNTLKHQCHVHAIVVRATCRWNSPENMEGSVTTSSLFTLGSSVRGVEFNILVYTVSNLIITRYFKIVAHRCTPCYEIENRPSLSRSFEFFTG